MLFGTTSPSGSPHPRLRNHSQWSGLYMGGWGVQHVCPLVLSACAFLPRALAGVRGRGELRPGGCRGLGPVLGTGGAGGRAGGRLGAGPCR